MSTNSNDQGRAYEYAWMTALYKKLAAVRKTCVVANSSLDANKRAWNAISQDKRELYALSADAAVDMVLGLEPLMKENQGTLFLAFQKDEAGENGDVRDIVIYREDIPWEVGLSIKHNHTAVKHSSPAIFVNILLIKNKFMKNEHQKKSHIGSLLIRYLMKWFYAAVRTG